MHCVVHETLFQVLINHGVSDALSLSYYNYFLLLTMLFLAERKNLFFGKVSRSLKPARVTLFLAIYSWGVDSNPLSKIFSNNATDLKLGSNVELPSTQG